MKRRRIIGGCALVVWLAVLPPSGSAGVLAAQGGAMLRDALRDPSSVLSGRSPGQRGAGALVQSKPLMTPAPIERVLSPVRERPPVAANLDNLPNKVMEVLNPVGTPLPAGPGVNGAGPPLSGFVGSPGGLIPPGGGIGGGGSGGGGGGGGGGGVIPPAPPPVVSSVPEPATWVMMIAGVGLIGFQLRRRRSAGMAAAA